MLGVSHLFWALYIQFTPLIFATNSTMKLPCSFSLFFKIHPETDAERVACPGGQNWCLNWGFLASEFLFPKTVMYLWWRWLYSQDLGLTAIPCSASFLLPLCCLPVPSSLWVWVSREASVQTLPGSPTWAVTVLECISFSGYHHWLCMILL